MKMQAGEGHPVFHQSIAIQRDLSYESINLNNRVSSMSCCGACACDASRMWNFLSRALRQLTTDRNAVPAERLIAALKIWRMWFYFEEATVTTPLESGI